jgi:hypothetical protein
LQVMYFADVSSVSVGTATTSQALLEAPPIIMYTRQSSRRSTYNTYINAHINPPGISTYLKRFILPLYLDRCILCLLLSVKRFPLHVTRPPRFCSCCCVLKRVSRATGANDGFSQLRSRDQLLSSSSDMVSTASTSPSLYPVCSTSAYRSTAERVLLSVPLLLLLIRDNQLT